MLKLLLFFLLFFVKALFSHEKTRSAGAKDSWTSSSSQQVLQSVEQPLGSLALNFLRWLWKLSYFSITLSAQKAYIMLA